MDHFVNLLARPVRGIFAFLATPTETTNEVFDLASSLETMQIGTKREKSCIFIRRQRGKTSMRKADPDLFRPLQLNSTL